MKKLYRYISLAIGITIIFLLVLQIRKIAFNKIGASGERYIDTVFTDVTTTQDVIYGQAPSLTGGGNEILKMDIYAPAGDSETKRPLIIFAHGGSFVGGNKNGMTQVAKDYAQRGYVTASINYRLTNHAVVPSSPDIKPISQQAKYDFLAAVRFMRANANKYGVDEEKIVIGGFSAGAFTSLYAAYDIANVGSSGTPGISSKVAAIASFSGGMLPSDIGVISAGDPPAILVNGTEDTTVPISLAQVVIDRLNQLKIQNELAKYNVGHQTLQVDDAHTKVRNFLYKVLNLSESSIEPNASPSPSSTPTGTPGTNTDKLSELITLYFPEANYEIAKERYQSGGDKSLFMYIYSTKKYTLTQIKAGYAWWRQ